PRRGRDGVVAAARARGGPAGGCLRRCRGVRRVRRRGGARPRAARRDRASRYRRAVLESGVVRAERRPRRLGDAGDRSGSSAGFAGATDSWGEVSEGGQSPPPRFQEASMAVTVYIPTPFRRATNNRDRLQASAKTVGGLLD